MQSITSSVLFFSVALSSAAAAGPVVCLISKISLQARCTTSVTHSPPAASTRRCIPMRAMSKPTSRLTVSRAPNEMYPNNVAVEFDATSAGLSAAVRAKFDYHEAGGINVMEVNGSVIAFPNFYFFALNGSTWRPPWAPSPSVTLPSLRF